MLPNFLIIGAAKAGTTSLYRYLREHPQVHMSETKELKFFTSRTRWRLGLRWYGKQFEGAGSALAVGEASPSYTRYPLYRGVPGRIARVMPEGRLIYLVRNPIDRMRSQYIHRVLQGREHRQLDEAVFADPSYLDVSRYALQIEQYLSYFVAEQLLILTTEDLRTARAATLRRVYTFLGVDPGWESPALEHEFNRTSQLHAQRQVAKPLLLGLRLGVWAGVAPRTVHRLSHRPTDVRLNPNQVAFSEPVRQRLQAALRDDVTQLRKYLGPEFDGWGIG
jgi:Sulfotransferase domain